MAAKTVVIDASVASKWFLLEPDRPAARSVQRDHDLIAPELIIAEVMNAIWKNVRQSRVDPIQVPLIADALPRSFSRLWPLLPLLPRAVEISLALDHPIYDAFYIALAEQEGVNLVTADERLWRKTRRTPYAGRLRKLG